LLDDFDRLIGDRTKLVALVHASNVLGTINPLREITALAHERGALVLADAAQSVPHMPVDVQDLDVDFLAFSSHKMMGPTGVGILYTRRSVLEEMDPFLGGGEMIRKVTLEESTWNDLPWRFEAGTPNIADVVALGAAIDYLEGLGMEAVRAHEVDLVRYALERLKGIPGLTLYGPHEPESRGGVVAFNCDDIHPHDIGTALDSFGIAIRAGHHCAQPLMQRLGVVATARASFYVYNKREEIDALAEGIQQAVRFFERVTPS
jgi:cysteine desulfurase/selenocysteine lyase